MLEQHDKKLREYKPLLEGGFDEKGQWRDGVFQRIQRSQTVTRGVVSAAVILIPVVCVVLQWLLLRGISAGVIHL